jgi:ssDNA-binding Zn-finger/Zn-ribbon topoisomerase 1
MKMASIVMYLLTNKEDVYYLSKLNEESRRESKKGAGGMKCKKCGGLMVLQSFFDHFINFDGWKCLNCGRVALRKEKTIEFDAFSLFYQQQRCRSRG